MKSTDIRDVGFSDHQLMELTASGLMTLMDSMTEQEDQAGTMPLVRYGRAS
jgi:hypothetical protein